jgi:[acyl-carrier-protein] S-malonyltransferase
MTTQVAFLFPGQGSQAVGMGADVFATSPAARKVFETVDQALGFPLSTLCFQGPEDMVRETVNAQPAIVTVSLALLAALQETLSPHNFSWSSPLVPGYSAGHSVGENTSLVVSSALDLKNTALLVRERGRLMHHEGTVCPGGMAAIIGMDADQLQEICEEATTEAIAHYSADASDKLAHPGLGRVIVANFNAPGQIVISGERFALQVASELAKKKGAKRVIPLPVSGAFHSPVMEPAAVGLAQTLQATSIQDASIPIISNIHATPLIEAQTIREELAQQIASPVQWIRSIEYLAGAGVTVFIEIGPGQALTGMVKRIIQGAATVTISNMVDIEKATTTLREMGLVHEV